MLMKQCVSEVLINIDGLDESLNVNLDECFIKHKWARLNYPLKLNIHASKYNKKKNIYSILH